EQGATHDPGVVDQDVRRTVGLEQRGRGRLDGVVVRDVDRGRLDAVGAVRGAELGDRALELGRVPVPAVHERRALAQRPRGVDATHADRRPGDQHTRAADLEPLVDAHGRILPAPDAVLRGRGFNEAMRATTAWARASGVVVTLAFGLAGCAAGFPAD